MNNHAPIIEIDSEEFFKFRDACNPFFRANQWENPLATLQLKSGHRKPFGLLF